MPAIPSAVTRASELELLEFAAYPTEGPELPLRPSQRLVQDILAPAVAKSRKAQACARSKRYVLVVATIPHIDWIEPLHAVVAHIVAGGGRGGVRVISPRREREAYEVEFDRVLSSLATNHVLVAMPDGIPDEVVAAADVVVDLTAITDAQFQAVIAREFEPKPGDPLTHVPLFVDISELKPEFLDAAIDRSQSPAEAVRLTALATSEVRKRRKKREDELEANYPTSSRKTSPTEILHPVTPKVEDLAGYGAAAAWAADLVRDLSDYRNGGLGWEDVDDGCLLHGPPGTGKTMFVSALAASAGLPFIPTSYADWQSQGEAHQGTLIKAMRRRFADANANAPCILFIDEIDTLPARGSGERYDDWWTAITNSLLECLDGSARREGVVVIAACNDASRLDPALVRSGRLDRRFEVALPDEEALTRIIGHHLPDVTADVAGDVATILAGSASGADISRIAREARRAARRSRRSVTAADLLAVAMPPCDLSDEDRRLVAVHEAGHAVTAIVLGYSVANLTIVQQGIDRGGVGVDCGSTMIRTNELERRVVSILGGRAAEEVLLGEVSGGAGSDLEEAAKLIAKMLGQCGLGDRLAPAAPSTAEVEARMRSLYTRSVGLITAHRADVESLAELAIERRVLGRKAIAEFAIARGLTTAGGAA